MSKAKQQRRFEVHMMLDVRAVIEADSPDQAERTAAKLPLTSLAALLRTSDRTVGGALEVK